MTYNQLGAALLAQSPGRSAGRLLHKFKLYIPVRYTIKAMKASLLLQYSYKSMNLKACHENVLGFCLLGHTYFIS